MKVLVVDDEPDIRLVAEAGLRAAGLEVVTATTGEDGIRKATEEQPDVVLLDVMMTGMDGYAVFGALRAGANTSRIPVIFLTAKNPDSSDTRRHTAGAAGFINKPFAPRELADQVLALLRSR